MMLDRSWCACDVKGINGNRYLNLELEVVDGSEATIATSEKQEILRPQLVVPFAPNLVLIKRGHLIIN